MNPNPEPFNVFSLNEPSHLSHQFERKMISIESLEGDGVGVGAIRGHLDQKKGFVEETSFLFYTSLIAYEVDPGFW